MQRAALQNLKQWWTQKLLLARKPLVIRGARQVGKSFLIRDFCLREGLQCLELNFEKEPSLRQLFVEGHNSKTVTLLETHFQQRLTEKTLLFLDEIQAATEIFARLRYFYEDTPHIPVIAAGSLLEFALEKIGHSVPVGRIEYLYLGPMRFEEYLYALKKRSLLDLIAQWNPYDLKTALPPIFHEQLLAHVRDFSLVGGMPEALQKFIFDRNFLECHTAHQSILDTYRSDFGKFHKRVPLDRIERVFNSISAQIGKKWVHSRISAEEKAKAIDQALHLLCQAKVAHRIYHSSGNGIPLASEQKDNLFKVLFLDIGLMNSQLGLRITDLIDPQSFAKIHTGALAEQWIGQHLLDLREPSQPPNLFYWVREKAGSLAEIDYLIQQGARIYPVEVKAGSSSKIKSLQVFLLEKQKTSPIGIHFSSHPPYYHSNKKILELPFYLVEQLPRILKILHP